MKIFFLEGFFQGSHRRFAEGWGEHSVHRIEIMPLPGRFWKWRMRAGAMELARIARERGETPDLWFATSMIDAAHFLALMGRDTPPLALYFHECQASYPAKEGADLAERDYQYLLTDLASAGAADRVYFNSHALRRDFFASTEEFLRRMPDARPLWLLEEIEKKALVLPLGLELSDLAGEGGERRFPLNVLWPHRWEHDKNPEEFFGVMEELDREGADFRLLIAGGRYGRWPEVFERVKTTLSHRIDHFGEVRERGEYADLLSRADVVVSTARHETFGAAMVEASAAGAHPLAPARLSYPEVIPEEFHARSIYADREDLKRRLAALLAGEAPTLDRKTLAEKFLRYDWKNRVADFDRAAMEISQMVKR